MLKPSLLRPVWPRRSSAVPSEVLLTAPFVERIQALEARLEESEATLEAIRCGQVDALVLNVEADHQVVTIENADRPYRVLFDQIAEGAVSLAQDGTVLYCNRRLGEMLEEEPERMIGQKLQPYIAPPDVAEFEVLLAASAGATARGEIILWRAGHSATPVNLSLSPLQHELGGTLRCGVLTDITQRRIALGALSVAHDRIMAENAQREAIEIILQQSQKMEAVGQLTGGIAHDFNNLLTAILGSLEVMQTRLDQGRAGELERYLATAASSAKRAAALSQRLLAFSRRQMLEEKAVSPNQLVGGLVELLQRTVGPMIRIRTVLPDDVGLVLCDPNQLENALLNLAINARDSMPHGGQLTIETARLRVDDSARAGQALPAGHYVVVSVTDTGTGMAPEVEARAFEPFFTTKPLGKGTGLGLPMIETFARQSGGRACIQSTLGNGTTVRLYLPRREAMVTQEPAPSTPPRRVASGAGRTVLVVDDEESIRMLIVELLNELGFTVLEAEDGLAALEAAEAAGKLDLLVTDFGLPNAMDGRQLASAVQVKRPELPVLFITGFANMDTDGEQVRNAQVITKPFGLDALAARIQAILSAEPADCPAA